MYNFMKQNYIEVERGVEYRNYQRESAILTDFWQKRRLKDSKMKKLIKKSQKLTKKNQEICANFQLETHFQTLQNTGISLRGWNYNIVSNEIYFDKKPN